MITKKKISIYMKYSGDIDAWARTMSKSSSANMNDNDWSLMNEFLQDFRIIKQGLASQEYVERFHKKLKESCDNEATIKQIKKLAEKE